MSQSKEHQDQYSQDDFENKSAYLIIGVDNDGEIEYNVNWQPTTEGLYGAACIFYKLLAGNLSEQIFNEIKDQCVLNNNQSDYFAILQIINKLASLDNENKNDNELVVRPDQLVL